MSAQEPGASGAGPHEASPHGRGPLAPDMQHRVVEMARLAPSAHNTQPARWRFQGDGSILLLGDAARRLPQADPHDRDFAISCGAALEGTVLALGILGIGVDHVVLEPATATATTTALRPMARVITRDSTGDPDPLAHRVGERHTCRGGFAPLRDEDMAALQSWADAAGDACVARSKDDRAWLADLNDRVTMNLLRDGAWRAELNAWMRLSRRQGDYDRDGMNREALHMGAVDAAGARWVLGEAFGWLDRLGLAAALVGERARSMTASAVVLLHRPLDETPVHSGRILYRHWLELTSLGLSCWPMSAAVDDPAGAAAIADRLAVPGGRRLLAALRVGKAIGKTPGHVRLPVAELIVS